MTAYQQNEFLALPDERKATSTRTEYHVQKYMVGKRLESGYNLGSKPYSISFHVTSIFLELCLPVR